MRIQAPRGTHDLLPSESARWQALEATFRDVVERYGYREIRTPAFEDTELFARTSGETSELVTKQMYTFTDKGGRSVTLKPEGTAPVVRAYVEHNLGGHGGTTRLWYATPIFRYERPSLGRFRQAHQVGLELLGSSSPGADAEIIEITVRFYQAVGLTGVKVLVNSLGRAATREAYREALLAYAERFLATQSTEIQDQTRKNPLRLLDSKDPDIQAAMHGAPRVLDYLEDDSKAHFDAVLALVAEAELSVKVAPEVVRGLDYYTDTVFEVQAEGLGDKALCGGGRYDELVRELDGPPTPSVGVAMGIERALMAQDQEAGTPEVPRRGVFLVAATQAARSEVRRLARVLRAEGLVAMLDLDGRSLKSQLKHADREGARWAALVGDDELAAGTVTLRDLSSSSQEALRVGDLAHTVRLGS